MYVTVKAVLQEAGLWSQQVGEILDGTVNGTNAVFTTTYKPLVQRTDGEEVAVADVAAYVNGSPVTVASLNATTGALTLASAPANGTTVTGDYASSAVSQSDVAGVIAEAADAIDLELTGVTTVPFSTVPATVRKIARFYAAGLLMSREYGLESITEESNKEGKRKLEQAEEWLTAYRARLVINTSDTGNYDTPRSTPDKRIFEEYDATNDRWNPPASSSVTVNRRS